MTYVVSEARKVPDETAQLREDLRYAIDALSTETTRRLAHDRFITDRGLWQEFIQTDAYKRAYALQPSTRQSPHK